MALIAFGPWLPDQPDFQNPGSATMLNVLPRTPGSYGPAPSMQPVSGALSNRCQGAAFAKDSAANVWGFAGDVSKLYKFIAGSTNWIDITRVIAVPALNAPSTSTTGGTLAAGTYYYVITALTANGETTKSNEASQATTGTTSTVTLTWPAVTNATGYRVYRGTGAGLENVYYAPGNVTTFTDTGAAATAGTPPGANTATVSYSTSGDGQWNFTQFGDRILSTNFTDPVQSFLTTSSSRFDLLSSGAPRARYMAAVRDFVMVANTSDGTYGARPQRVWWPAIGDPTTWPTPGTNAAAEVQSDFQDLLGDGGWNQGVIGGLLGADAVIVQEYRIWRAVYVGSPDIFDFAILANIGTPAPGSIVKAENLGYLLAQNGFYATDGMMAIPIGAQQIDRTFWEMVDQNNLFRITAAADPLHKIIYWAFPGPENTGGLCNYVIAYNYEIKRWSLIQQLTEVMVQALSVGYTLDQLVAFGTLDQLAYPLDSRVWTGGNLNLGCFDSSHKLNFVAGVPLAATMESSEANLNDKGLAYVSRVWPIIDTNAAQITVGVRDRLGDSVVWGNPGTMTATTGSVPCRATGVYQRTRIEVPAGVAWTQAQGINFDWRAAGRR